MNPSGRRASAVTRPGPMVAIHPGDQNQPQRRDSQAKPPSSMTPAPTPETKKIRPPDRQQERIQRRSVVQAPSPFLLQVPDKQRRTSQVAAPQNKLLGYRAESNNGRRQSTAMAPGSKRLSTINGPTLEQAGGAGGGGLRGNDQLSFRKPNKAEKDEYYSHLKTEFKFHKSSSFGSLESFASTLSSMSSIRSTLSFMDTLKSSAGGSSIGAGSDSGSGSSDWSMRWCISKAGRQPGQIRCARDLCMMTDGNVAVTEEKNARVQVFTQSGKSAAILGPDSENVRTARSFNNPMSFRKMQPTGICEARQGSLLVVTDLNRLLYIDASLNGLLEAELIIKEKTHLHGVASTESQRLIISEVGMQPSVGVYETNGKLVREFKGDFKKPSYLAWTEDYEIVAVSDGEAGCVYLYDINGHLINKFGQRSATTGSGDSDTSSALIYPSGITWLSEGRLLVADRADSRVVMFDLRNLCFEDVLTATDGLKHPVALATNKKNRIVVTEEFYDFGVNQYQLKMFKRKSMIF